MLDKGTFSILSAMQKRLMSHRYIKSLLSNGVAEESIYSEITTIEGKKIKIKIRYDFCQMYKRLIIDLKTTSDASISVFPRNASEFDYQIQAALYLDIMEAITHDGLPWTFFFIAQEKNPPFAFNIFEASPQFIGQGRYEWQQLALLFQWCKENDKWPGYQCFTENKFGVNMLNLPAYKIQELTWYDHKF
jgi:hypothetical protein